MSALSEAKQFVGLHARHMGLRPAFVAGILGRISSLDGAGPASWVHEWSVEADAAVREREGRTAANLYNLARFPCADTTAKLHAAERAAQTLGTWLATHGAGERRTARVQGNRVTFLFRAAARPDAPLVILMGGIVSLKEQWAGFLALGPRLGCAVAIVDFPGVGENGVLYTRAAAGVFGAIMDAIEADCDTRHTLIVAPSFGGHLAILRAHTDARVRGIVTIGAPLAHFFTDPRVRHAMPAITSAALMQAMGSDIGAFDRRLSELALGELELAALPVPLTYVASLRDEIIPPQEWQEAAALTNKLRIYPFDDVHGAPRHLREIRLLILAALLRHAGRARLAGWVERLLRWTRRAKPLRTQFA
jgi:esterase FrsA